VTLAPDPSPSSAQRYSGLGLAFAGQPLDRADHVRTDPARLAEARKSGVLLQLDGLLPVLDGEDRLVWAPAGEAPADAELVFLGLLDGRAAFAQVPPYGDSGPAYAHRPAWAEVARLSGPELAIYGEARTMLDWHARHRFCAQCGGPTEPAKGGWQRDCPACEAQHFPRVDPVAIMLVECEGKLLLGRQSRFPPRSFSALAGFVEPGETIEEAVAREVFEEAGVRVTGVRYVASQPWPFPSQLMIGCIGYASSLELTIDKAEIEDARWFTRAEVAEALDKGSESSSFIPPPKQAIAYEMLRWWLEQG
jgi:NAD+ diphosphatase